MYDVHRGKWSAPLSIAFLFLLIASSLHAQPITPTTPYTRGFLIQPTAAACRAYLGITSGTGGTNYLFNTNQFVVNGTNVSIKDPIYLTNVVLVGGSQGLNWDTTIFNITQGTNFTIQSPVTLTNVTLAENVVSPIVALGNQSGTLNVNAALSVEFSVVPTGNLSIQFTNWSDAHPIRIRVANTGNFAVTWTNSLFPHYWYPNGNSTQITNDWGNGVNNGFSFMLDAGVIYADDKTGLGGSSSGTLTGGGASGTMTFWSSATSLTYSTNTVVNIAALKLQLADQNPLRFVKGYFSEDDGGGGWFMLTNTILATNQGTRFQITGQTSSWERLHGGTLDVRQFGALGDGTTDDTGSVTNCLNFCFTNNFEAHIPKGSFPIGPARIDVPSNAFISGDGPGSIIFARTNAITFNISTVTNVVLRNFKIGGSAVIQLYMPSSSSIILDHLDISGATVAGAVITAGLQIEGCNNISVLSPYFHNNGVASTNLDHDYNMVIDFLGVPSTGITVEQPIVVNQNSKFGIGVYTSRDFKISDFYIDMAGISSPHGYTGYGLFSYGGAATSGSRRFSAVNGTITNTFGTGLYINNTVGAEVIGVQLAQVSQGQDDTTLAVGGIAVNASADVRLVGNLVTNAGPNSGIVFAQTTNCIAANNNIWLPGTNHAGISLRSYNYGYSLKGNSIWESHRGIADAIGNGISDGADIEGNLIRNAYDGILLSANSSNTVIRANRIKNTQDYSIVEQGKFNTILGNVLEGGNFGIALLGTNGLVQENTVIGHTVGAYISGLGYRFSTENNRLNENTTPISDVGGDILKIVASGTTLSVKDAPSYWFAYTAPATITAFTDGIVGVQRTFFSSNANVTIQNNATTLLSGSVDFNMAAIDSLTLRLGPSNAWYEVGRSPASSGGGGGTTINPSNGVLPYRSSATVFSDSPISTSAGTNISISGFSTGSKFISTNGFATPGGGLVNATAVTLFNAAGNVTAGFNNSTAAGSSTTLKAGTGGQSFILFNSGNIDAGSFDSNQVFNAFYGIKAASLVLTNALQVLYGGTGTNGFGTLAGQIPFYNQSTGNLDSDDGRFAYYKNVQQLNLNRLVANGSAQISLYENDIGTTLNLDSRSARHFNTDFTFETVGGSGNTGHRTFFVNNGVTNLTISIDYSTLIGDGTTTTTRSNMWLYIPTTAGTPTGVPHTETGTVPLEYDTSNLHLNVYSGAAWHQIDGGGGGGTTINPTDTVVPYRSNATTFADSPIAVSAGTNMSFAGFTTGSKFTSTNGFATPGGGLVNATAVTLFNAGGAVTLFNNSTAIGSSTTLKAGTGTQSFILFNSGNVNAGSFDTNQVFNAFFGVHAESGVFTNGVTLPGVLATNIVTTDANKKLTAATIGTGLTWTPSTLTLSSAGGTINATDGVLPYRSSATAFSDSTVSTSNGSTIVGDGTTTTSRTNKFLYVPTSAGVPSGSPQAFTGTVPLVIDTTGDHIFWYRAGWRRSGDVLGPASSVLNAIPTFDSTSGRGLQNTGVSIDGSGNLKLVEDSKTYLNFTQNDFIQSGTGSPEGAVTAGIGSLWSRRNGSTATTLYVKESGTGNTGWTAVGAGGGAGILPVWTNDAQIVKFEPTQGLTNKLWIASDGSRYVARVDTGDAWPHNPLDRLLEVNNFQTNVLTVSPNGGIMSGRNTETFWGGAIAENYEALVSVHVVTGSGIPDVGFNQIYIGATNQGHMGYLDVQTFTNAATLTVGVNSTNVVIDGAASSVTAKSFIASGTGNGTVTLWDNAGTHNINFIGASSITTNINLIFPAAPNTGLLLGTLSAGTNETISIAATVPAAQFPALTGDVTTSAGSLATAIKSSVALLGDPTAPNVVLSDSDTTIANTAFVKSNITASAALSVLKAGDTMSGTLTVTGLTNTALTASAAVVTAADKSLASVAYTGAGNVMRTRTGVFRNITIPTDGWIINATNAATASTNNYTGTGYFSVPLYSFADLQTNRITRIFEMPEAWDASTVKFKFHWSCTNTTGDVKWWVHAKILPDNGDPATAWGTSVSVTDTAQTASRPLFSGATGAMTFGGTPAAGGLAIVEVYRDAGDSGDTLAGSAELWSINLGYTETATEPTAW